MFKKQSQSMKVYLDALCAVSLARTSELKRIGFLKCTKLIYTATFSSLYFAKENGNEFEGLKELQEDYSNAL